MEFAEHKSADEIVASTRVLLIDGDFHMRKVVRNLLLSLGIRSIEEAASGTEGIEAVCKQRPDLVFLDWDMPDLSGGEILGVVRSPDTFPQPDVPIVVLTAKVDRERVLEAVRRGANEFLCKPVSARALRDRILTVRARPRPMVRIGSYYGPQPRKPASASMPQADPLQPAWV